MAHILFADESIPFDGQSMERGPLGGAESAFISLLEVLARRGHKISVRNKCIAPLDYKGISWRPLGTPWPEDADVYVANRSAFLLHRSPQTRKRIFWIHNPAGYLLKWRYLWRLAYFRPSIIFSGEHHKATYPVSAPPWLKQNSRVIIPYGIDDRFCQTQEKSSAPKPKVIFTSNPLRGLDWLLQLWAEKIFPHVPQAELHVFSGASTYKAQGTELGHKMDEILRVARCMENKGVRLRDPLPKDLLIQEMQDCRAILYKGDVGETFCLALAESQAMGIPAVVRPIGCVAERVAHGKTGFVAESDDAFCQYGIEILTNDLLWQELHHNSLNMQRSWKWDQAALEFEKLF